MPTFPYVALDRYAKEVSGTIEADNLQDAVSKIRGKGLYPTDVTNVMGISHNETLTETEKLRALQLLEAEKQRILGLPKESATSPGKAAPNPWKDRLMGAAVGIFLGFVATLLWGWWMSTH